MRSLWPSWQPDWVLFEDPDLLVVDKPSMVPCHAGGHGDDLVARLKAWFGEGGETDPYLGQVHALDRAASGLVALSRHKEHNRSLADQFKLGVPRSYLVGLSSLGGLAEERRQARPGSSPHSSPRQANATLSHRVVERRGKRMLVELRCETRSQPIRRIMASMGAPIAGDRDHRGAPASRLLLHASGIDLVHPRSGKPLCLTTPPPARFSRWLQGSDAPFPSDPEEIFERMREAISHRFSLSLHAHSNMCRLVNGAGDDLPGVTLDRYGRYLVVALSDDAAKAEEAAIIEAVNRLGGDGVYLKRRPKQANVVADTRRDDVAPKQAVQGSDAPDPLQVEENGLSFEARLGDGLSTGIFLDQRPGRKCVHELSKDARVLNLFCYHGAFTTAAIAGGASHTSSVDSSRHALAQAARSLAPYGAPSLSHQLIQSEARAWLERCAHNASGDRFDLIVLDPPSFSTTKQSKFQAKRDYQKLAELCLRCLKPQGRLLACCNHHGIKHADFVHKLRAAAEDAGLALKGLKALPEAIDFPPPPGRESYLKSYLLQIADR